jgi:hypothetical protein
VDVPDGSTTPGTQVDLWDCNGGAGQQWVYNAGQLQVYGTPTMCLDAQAQTLDANGTVVQIWPCNGGSNQQWIVESDGTLRNADSGRCLDATNAGTANGTLLQLWDCNGGAQQQWTVAADLPSGSSTSAAGSTDTAGGGGGTAPATSVATPLTASQRYAKALRACRNLTGRHRRDACEARAEKAYKAAELVDALQDCRKLASQRERRTCSSEAFARFGPDARER